MVTRRFDGSMDVDGFLSRQVIGTSKLLSDAREHRAIRYHLFDLCAAFSGLYVVTKRRNERADGCFLLRWNTLVEPVLLV